MIIRTTAELFATGLKISYTGDMANPSGCGAIVSLAPQDSWGGPYARIILSDGRDMLSNDVRHLKPASERQGCKHRLLIEDGYLNEEEIAGLFAAAAMRKATESAKKQQAATAYSLAVEKLKVEHPTLEQGDDHKTAAKNIRQMLKAAFPKIKFSVTAPHYDTINIKWTDGPTGQAVEAIVNQFSAGSFDGYDDSYKYSHSAWSNIFGSAKYIFCNRDHSPALVTAAIESLAKYHGGQLPTAEDFKNGRLFNVCPSRNSETWNNLIFKALRDATSTI